MKFSTWIKLINALIVLTIIVNFAVTFLLAMNTLGLVSSLRVGEPSINSSESVVEISFPISLTNRGPFALSDIHISADLRGDDGNLIVSALSQSLSIPAGGRETQRYLLIRIDLSEIPQERLSELFSQASNLTLSASAGATIAPFVSASLHLSGEIPWSPPIKNFRLGDPDFLGYNSTHVLASMPVLFENSLDVGIDGMVNLLIVDADTGSEIGSGLLVVNAPSRSEFTGELQFSMKLPENTTTLILEERILRYNATFGFFVFGMQVHSFSSPFEIVWRPLVGSPHLGSPSMTPYNSTHTIFNLPFAFTNTNEIIALDGSARLALLVGSSLVAESQTTEIHVPPSSGFHCELAMLVPNWALSMPGTLVLSLETQFGSTSLEVPVNG